MSCWSLVSFYFFRIKGHVYPNPARCSPLPVKRRDGQRVPGSRVVGDTAQGDPVHTEG